MTDRSFTELSVGCVGSAAGSCRSGLGNHTVCVGVVPLKIDTRQRSGAPIYQLVLGEVIRRNDSPGRLHFTADPQVIARFEEVRPGPVLAVGILAFKLNTGFVREVSDGQSIENWSGQRERNHSGDAVLTQGAKRPTQVTTDLDSAIAVQAALLGEVRPLIVAKWLEVQSPDFDVLEPLPKPPLGPHGPSFNEPESMQAFGVNSVGVSRSLHCAPT